MSKGKNKEVQSRRDFFKKVAKGALPILGAVVLSSVPVLTKAESEPQPVSAAVPMHITAIRVQSIFFVFIILLSFLMCCRLYS